MDYIRWLVNKIDFMDAPTIPISLVVAFGALFVSFIINPILCIAVSIVIAIVYGTVLYVIISDAVRKSYAKYLEEKNKP
jgi:hypothetical protein